MRNEARRELILQLIQGWPTLYGCAPSYRELAEAADCTVSVAHHHVQVLQERGQVTSRSTAAQRRVRTLRAVA